MTLYGAVSGFIFISAVRAYQHGGHHGKITVSGCHHVTHYVAVIVLAGPDEAALGTDHARHGVVDQRVEILDAKLLKLCLILVVINLLEDVLEVVVILLRDGILGRKPEILLGVDGIAKACSCEAGNGLIRVVNALDDAAASKVVEACVRGQRSVLPIP